jgi:hypothetical protein
MCNAKQMTAKLVPCVTAILRITRCCHKTPREFGCDGISLNFKTQIISQAAQLILLPTIYAEGMSRNVFDSES